MGYTSPNHPIDDGFFWFDQLTIKHNIQRVLSTTTNYILSQLRYRPNLITTHRHVIPLFLMLTDFRCKVGMSSTSCASDITSCDCRLKIHYVTMVLLLKIIHKTCFSFNHAFFNSVPCFGQLL